MYLIGWQLATSKDPTTYATLEIATQEDLVREWNRLLLRRDVVRAAAWRAVVKRGPDGDEQCWELIRLASNCVPRPWRPMTAAIP